jgi:hypothetical protein
VAAADPLDACSTAARSASVSAPNARLCGVRPIITISRTVKSNSLVVHPVDGLEDRGLAAAVRPEQAGELPVVGGQADVGDDALPGDIDRQVIKAEAHCFAPYR